MRKTENINVRKLDPLITPAGLKFEQPLSESGTDAILEGRETVKKILNGEDPRLMAIVGPCSIHDEKAGLEYAQRLLKLAKQVNDRLYVVMRVYFEKPRTTVGWKGLINDPDLDGSFQINKGLRKARELLLNINELGLPAGTEYLDTISPQYFAI